MRIILCKTSILVPLTVIYLLFLNPITLVITELGIYWGYGTTTYLFILLIVVWLCCSPFRKSCCNGRWTEVLFNLISVEFPAMFLFAQWHFAVFVILFLVLVFAEIGLFLLLRKDEENCRYTRKRRRMYQNAFRRGSMLITAVICAVPCFLALFVYDMRSPSYQAEEEIRDRLFADAQDAAGEVSDPYLENRDLLLCFTDDRWESYDIDERITIMQELVDFESERLGIPSIPVAAELLGNYILGQYSNETNEMWIDIEYLSDAPVEECIRTICHEVYHSFQYYLVNSMDWENEALQSVYFTELRSWKANQENYQSVEVSGYEAYAEQALEVTARSYANQEAERILSYIP